MKGKSLSRVQLLVTPWTAAHQAPPSMGFSRQEGWSRGSLPSPKFIAKYFIIVGAIVNGITFLIFFSDSSLLVETWVIFIW